MIYAAALKNGIDMSYIPTIEVTTIIKGLWNDLRQYYKDHNSRRDGFLLNRANFASDAIDDDKCKRLPWYQKNTNNETAATGISITIVILGQTHKK